jgi:hypothetical protein
MSERLRWTLRVVAILNIVLFASDLYFPRSSPLALFAINLSALWSSMLWAVLTSLSLPIYALVEMGRLNDANRAQQRKPVLIDGLFAFGWCIFFWGTMLWKFTHTITWL